MAHIPIPSRSFWRGMSVKIIWIWRTAIVIAKNDQKWCFLGIISALNKIFVFGTYPHPIMLVLKRYEHKSHLDLTHCNCYSQKRQIMMVFEQYLQLSIEFVCFARIPNPTCSFWRGMSVKVIWIWRTAIVIAKNDQKRCFLGIISALNKIFVFGTYIYPITLILKRYEC